MEYHQKSNAGFLQRLDLQVTVLIETSLDFSVSKVF